MTYLFYTMKNNVIQMKYYAIIKMKSLGIYPREKLMFTRKHVYKCSETFYSKKPKAGKNQISNQLING